MPTKREPSDAERRAIQQAVDAGDLHRARELIEGVRRRLKKSNGSKPQKQAAAKPKKARAASASSRAVVRQAGGTRYVRCPVCGREISVNRDGLLRPHKRQPDGPQCRGVERKPPRLPREGAEASERSREDSLAWASAPRSRQLRARRAAGASRVDRPPGCWPASRPTAG